MIGPLTRVHQDFKPKPRRWACASPSPVRSRCNVCGRKPGSLSAGPLSFTLLSRGRGWPASRAARTFVHARNPELGFESEYGKAGEILVHRRA
jgi:hypothetical protein